MTAITETLSDAAVATSVAAASVVRTETIADTAVATDANDYLTEGTSASLTLTVTKSFVDGVPTVSASATSVGGIVPEIFVFNSETRAYSHPASTVDLRRWGLATEPYYRSATVTRPCSSVQEAEQFATLLFSRARRLVHDWILETPFVSTSARTFSS